MNNEKQTLSFDLGLLEDGAKGENTIVREKIKGIQHYKILPPFGTDHGGSLSAQYTLHWGFMGENGKAKPVTCSYKHERFCPVCDRVKEAEDKLKRLKDTGGPEAEQEALTQYIKDFKRKNSFLYNAVTIDGRVVLLELTWTAHDELRKKIKEAVVDKSIDPCALDAGLWFTFKREGKGFLDTTYKVDFKKISVKVDGEDLEKLDKTPMGVDLQVRIKAQLAGGKGPMIDLHALYEQHTAADLGGYLAGKPVVSKKPKAEAEGAAPAATDAKQEEKLPDFPSGKSKKLPDVNAEMARLDALQKS